MLILWFFIVLIIVLFLIASILGAPYLPTLNKQVEAALDLIDLKKGQTLLELGSGDGRVLLAAAKRGINSIGYEINPILVLISLIRTIKYRHKVKIIWANYWRKDWPRADGVFVFLIERYMLKLDNYLKLYPYKPIKLVSFAFKIPGKKIVKTKSNTHLYIYT